MSCGTPVSTLLWLNLLTCAFLISRKKGILFEKSTNSRIWAKKHLILTAKFVKSCKKGPGVKQRSVNSSGRQERGWQSVNNTENTVWNKHSWKVWNSTLTGDYHVINYISWYNWEVFLFYQGKGVRKYHVILEKKGYIFTQENFLFTQEKGCIFREEIHV